MSLDKSPSDAVVRVDFAYELPRPGHARQARGAIRAIRVSGGCYVVGLVRKGRAGAKVAGCAGENVGASLVRVSKPQHQPAVAVRVAGDSHIADEVVEPVAVHVTGRDQVSAEGRGVLRKWKNGRCPLPALPRNDGVWV